MPTVVRWRHDEKDEVREGEVHHHDDPLTAFRLGIAKVDSAKGGFCEIVETAAKERIERALADAKAALKKAGAFDKAIKQAVVDDLQAQLEGCREDGSRVTHAWPRSRARELNARWVNGEHLPSR